jgi:AraC-like DNA-binding protein
VLSAEVEHLLRLRDASDAGARQLLARQDEIEGGDGVGLLRNAEARRLMLGGGLDASEASFRVGYESPSQFSREYRRLFGAPPRRDVDSIRRSVPSVAV